MLKTLKSKARVWTSLDNKRMSGSKSFGKLKMCKKCYTFYYKNSWHFDRPGYLDGEDEQEVAVRFTECPACLEEDASFYEAESGYVFGRA